MHAIDKPFLNQFIIILKSLITSCTLFFPCYPMIYVVTGIHEGISFLPLLFV